MLQKNVRLAIVCSLLLIAGFGCLPSPKTLLENAAETAINNQLGTSGSVDINDGNVTFTDETSGITGSYGADVKIPDDFPADIPLLEGGRVSGVAVTEEGAWVAFSTDMSVDEVVAWYENKLLEAGWEKQASYNTDGTLSEAFKKDNVVLGVMASDTATGTIVTVSESAS